MYLQIIINALINGLLLALVALGFHIIFSATKIFHIAHGAVYVAGVYFYYWINQETGIVPALALTLIFSFLLGILIEYFVYKPLLKKASNQYITLISSLGIYIILINIIVMIFGSDTIPLNNTISGSIHIGEISITQSQLIQTYFAIPLLVAFILFMKFSGLGLRVRAVADNSTLARVLGIKLQQVRYIVFGLGSVLATSAALLRFNDISVDPYSGMSITLSAAVVVVIGGSRSYYGTILGALMLAIVLNFTELYLSSQWKDSVTFSILIAVLLWRTEGILQFKIRTDEK